jgi:Tol biopolymer transport system component
MLGRMRVFARVVVAFVLLSVLMLVAPGPAHAAFPGQNGKIAFSDSRDDPNPSGCGSSCNYEIYSINPDGTGVSRLTTNPAYDLFPAWSPDGSKIVFISTRVPAGIYTMDANGGNVTFVRSGFDPSWSPDGTKILFVPDGGECSVGTGGLWKMNPDGTNQEFIACGPSGFAEDSEYDPAWSPGGQYIAFGADRAEYDLFRVNADGSNLITLTDSPNDLDGSPDWAPDGSKIAFARDPFTHEDIWTMDPDGTNPAPLTGDSTPEEHPAYSPDGTKIVFWDGQTPLGLYTMSSAGGPQTFLTQAVGGDPDWQPIPINSYPRPKGATPFYGSLTTAYEQCTAPDRTHGPPLVHGSCSSPQMASDYLTVGTGDSNAKPARNEGYLRLGVVPGILATPADEADVKLDFFSDDVFTKALADYTGELRAKVMLQITDKDNTPHPGGPGAATTTSIPLELTVGCTPVADPLEGSSCTASTTADALAPGTVKEGRRSIWGLGGVEVYDGGADGDAQTPAGDTLFATQGIFVP